MTNNRKQKQQVTDVINVERDRWWSRTADYFLARGGDPESEVISHEHECGCRNCRIFERAARDACVAIDFEDRELSA